MNSTNEKKFRLPDSVTGWVLLVLGLTALIAGAAGIINPGINSDPDGPVAAALMFSISLSALCNGILHFMAVLSRWQKFPYYAITARIVLFLGYTALILAEEAPASFVTGAVFEVVGAFAIAVSLAIDRFRKPEVKSA